MWGFEVWGIEGFRGLRGLHKLPHSVAKLSSLPQGLQWIQLSAEEIPSRIQAITGKRGRPRNTEKAKTKEVPKVKRGRGRPPKVKITEMLNKTENHLLKKLEAQGKEVFLTLGFCLPGVGDRKSVV